MNEIAKEWNRLVAQADVCRDDQVLVIEPRVVGYVHARYLQLAAAAKVVLEAREGLLDEYGPSMNMLREAFERAEKELW